MNNKKERKKEIVDNNHIGFRRMIGQTAFLLQEKGFQGGHTHVRASLEEIEKREPIDIAGTISWLESHGGYNDVEVMLNVGAVFC